MLFSEQLRAGRNLLGWSQDALALKSGVGVATIKRIEAKSGPVSGQAETIWKLQTTLEEAGLVFIANDATHGPGVRLREPFSRD